MDLVYGCSSKQIPTGGASLSEGMKKRINSIKDLEDSFQVYHGIFKWSFENFSIFPKDAGISCSSPPFALKETCWHMLVCSVPRNDGRVGILIKLARHAGDPGPDRVIASYALGLESSANKVWFNVKENVLFRKGDNEDLTTSVLGSLHNFVAGDGEDKDTLSVVCEIYVSYLSKIINPSTLKISQIDPTLSSNLVALFDEQKRAEILIEIRNYRVWVHKSVAYARSRTLARLLDTGKFFIQLSCNLSCLSCIVYYMYSGSFEYLAKHAVFSIGLYETACELSLPKLRDILTPYKTEKLSRIHKLILKKTCTIHGFKLEHLNYAKIETPVTHVKDSAMNVKIVFYKINPQSLFVCMHIKVGGIIKAFHVNVVVSILNKNSNPCTEELADILPNPRTEVRGSTLFTSFGIRQEKLLSCLKNGDLFINITCTQYSLTHKAHLSVNLCSLPYNCKNWIEELSQDFRNLLLTGKRKDLIIMAKGEAYEVHRCILAARSLFFRSLLYDKKYRIDHLELRGIEPRTVCLLLTYIYCGTLSTVQDLTIDDFSKLFAASVECKIPSLTDLCASIIDAQAKAYFEPLPVKF